ncbi:MAG TPA: hypothetical protein PLW44_07785 [Chitinophagales bacterium]|nr:hypothetical protein [Chitinophagales bacterium]
MNDTFQFTDKLKKQLFIMMGIGLLGLVWVFLLHPANSHSRFWSNLLANTYYFTGISLFGMFAVAAPQLAYGGWNVLTKRIFLSMAAFVRVSGFVLVAIVVLGIYNVHTLYQHILHIVHETPVKEIHTTKVVFFSEVFWISRIVAYAFLWAGFSWYMNKFFGNPNQTDPKTYKNSKLLAAAFIVTFAVTESAASWDYIMSLDPHWYSTLFGWYNFASYGCAAWAMTILLVIYLKSKGYLHQVNENHVHDLGKLLFGFSIFWTYLWFDQFMLQWYANMPEETNFWIKRFNEPYFKFTVFFALIVNFLFPLFFLIKRSAKRNFKLIGFGAALLIFGHYVDFFNYTFFESGNAVSHHAAGAGEHHAAAQTEKVVLYAQHEEHPAAATDATHAAENKEAVATEVKHEEAAHGDAAHAEKHADAAHGHEAHAAGAPHGKGGHHEAPVTNYSGIGIGEIMIFIGFLGAFLFAFFLNLSKRPIVPESDPYLKEAEKLTVTYS